VCAARHRVGPQRCRFARHVDDVLDRHRQAQQRTLVAFAQGPIGGVRVGQRACRGHHPKRPQAAVEMLDAPQATAHELPRRHLAPSQQATLLARIDERAADAHASPSQRPHIHSIVASAPTPNRPAPGQRAITGTGAGEIPMR